MDTYTSQLIEAMWGSLPIETKTMDIFPGVGTLMFSRSRARARAAPRVSFCPGGAGGAGAV